MGSPYPKCCDCWACNSEPESVIVVPSIESGNCCDRPDGTFVIGSAASTAIQSSRRFALNANKTRLDSKPTDQKCTWTWRYNWIGSADCATDFPGYWKNYLSTAGTYDYIAICQSVYTDTDPNGWNGEYNVQERTTDIHVIWNLSPKPTIAVYVLRWYYCLLCRDTSVSPFVGGVSQIFSMWICDEYKAESVDCSSLPTTILHTNRYSEVFDYRTGYPTPPQTDSYNYGPATYAACGSIASVDLTYA